MKKNILTVILFLAVGAAVFGESANPFTSTASKPQVVSPLQVAPGFVSAIVGVMTPTLRVLNDQLALLTRALGEKGNLTVLLVLLLVSFVYGIFHALGPGHGKTMVTTFFLSNNGKFRQSITVGYLLALVHAVSALSLVLILYFVIRGIFSTDFESASRIIRFMSFGIVAILGAVMLIRKIMGKEHHHFGHSHEHDHCQDHDSSHEHSHERETEGEVTTKQLWGIATASGLVPCPGASAVILLTLSLNMLWVSVLAVTMISLGMGITVSIFGILAILAKRGIVGTSALGGHHERRERIIRRVVEITGAAMLFLFGTLFFLAQF